MTSEYRTTTLENNTITLRVHHWPRFINLVKYMI